MSAFIYVFIGGGLGSMCRLAVNSFYTRDSMSLGTFTSNCVSCLILGVLIGLMSKGWLNNSGRLFFATGFCGGFSTFSTYGADILSLHEQGATLWALAYLFGSVIAGLACLLVGIGIVRLFHA